MIIGVGFEVGVAVEGGKFESGFFGTWETGEVVCVEKGVESISLRSSNDDMRRGKVGGIVAESDEDCGPLL